MRDLRTWLTAYSYWNQGGLANVVSMFLYLAKECFGLEAGGAAVGGWGTGGSQCCCMVCCCVLGMCTGVGVLEEGGWPLGCRPRASPTPSLIHFGTTARLAGLQPQEVVETPATGCLHPAHPGYFAGPAKYMRVV